MRRIEVRAASLRGLAAMGADPSHSLSIAPPRVPAQPANQPLQQAESLRVSDYLGCSVFRAIYLSSSSLLKRQSEPILIAGILAV
jgi:hypothetical protein